MESCLPISNSITSAFGQTWSLPAAALKDRFQQKLPSV